MATAPSDTQLGKGSQSRSFQDRFFDAQPSAREFFELFEYLPGAYFYAKDSRHRYVGSNEPVLRDVFGLESLDQLLGKTDLDFQPPALAGAYHAEDRRVMEAGATLPRQLWLVPHVRGAPSWYVSTKSPLRDPDGKVIGIVGVMYRVDSPADREHHFKELSHAIATIEARFSEDLSIAELAEESGLSSSQFNARFRELLRMSLTAYLQKLRVQAAQRLLAQSDRSIADIGHQVGFYDQSHFTKRFRSITGVTPLSYRKRFR
jgi:AraC-like DNA-binding protein